MGIKITSSRFTTSKNSEKILEFIHQNLGSMTKKKMHEEILKIDSSLPTYDAFVKFLADIERTKNRRAMIILNKIKDNKISDKRLMEMASVNLMALGNVVIDQTMREAQEIMEAGKKIPEKMKDQIMGWFFRGADAMTKGRMVDLKFKEVETMKTLVDNLITSAQYQKLDGKDDIVDADFEETLVQELDSELEREGIS